MKMKKTIAATTSIFLFVFAIFMSQNNDNLKVDTIETVTQTSVSLPVYQSDTTLYTTAITDETSLTDELFEMEGQDRSGLYLKYYYNISLENDTFLEALYKICKMAPPETVQEVSSWGEMLQESIRCVNKENLVSLYTCEKINSRLLFYGITEVSFDNLEEEQAYFYSNLVCALDLGLIDVTMAQHILDDNLSIPEQEKWLMAVADMSGNGRNYIGYSNEFRIYTDIENLCNLYSSMEVTLFEQLDEILATEENISQITLKNADFDANFLPSLTMLFSCEDCSRMTQIIGLLNSEGIVTKVQVEPKLVKENDSFHYDLVLEFETHKDMSLFCDALEQNAMNVNYFTKETSLLTKTPQCREIYKITIAANEETVSFYCLPKYVDEIEESLTVKLAESGVDVSIVSQKYLCNKGLYFSLGGTDRMGE